MLLFTLDFFFFFNFQISVVFLVSFCWLLGWLLGYECDIHTSLTAPLTH